MVPTHNLPEFLVTVYVLILIPGPSVLFTVSRGVALAQLAANRDVAGDSGGHVPKCGPSDSSVQHRYVI